MAENHPGAKKLAQRLIVGVALGLALYAGATIALGAKQLGQSLAAFSWWRIGPVLALSLVNYALRYLKWTIYLRHLRLVVPTRRSVAIFAGGLSMSVTPGKVGELLKAYLLSVSDGVPMGKTSGVVFAERFTDLIALVILMALGFLSFRIGGLVLAITGFGAVGLLVVLRSQRLSSALIRLLTRLPVVQRVTDGLDTFQKATMTLLAPRPLAIALVLSMGAWLAECVSTQLVINGMQGEQVSLLLATFIYSATTLGGLPTPGGLGLTDGSMAALLHLMVSMTTTSAAATTLLVRLATLWFAVLLGAVALWGLRNFLDAPQDMRHEHRN